MAELQWMKDAAEELVLANNDRGRTYDNSPNVDETVGIIAKHFAEYIVRSAPNSLSQEGHRTDDGQHSRINEPTQ